jgi:hypothetical protein
LYETKLWGVIWKVRHWALGTPSTVKIYQ